MSRFNGPQLIVVLSSLLAVLVWSLISRRRRLDTRGSRIHPLMRIPVPWVFMIWYLVGVGLEWMLPLGMLSPELRRIGWWLGVGLVVGGAFVAFSALRLFRRASTTTVPFDTPARLVTSGPYRFSRNPMYVGLTAIYLGVAGTRAEMWPVLILPVLLTYIDRVVIPVEEGSLHAVFGDSYQRYRAQVRRWLSVPTP